MRTWRPGMRVTRTRLDGSIAHGTTIEPYPPMGPDCWLVQIDGDPQPGLWREGDAAPDERPQLLLLVDPERRHVPGTGIMVRAKLRGEWGAHDIATLDSASLDLWLRSRGGDNELAERVVLVLLGHEIDRSPGMGPGE